AFRSSAEAMEGVRQLQAELVQALKRQDRSELVLQSTQALNDTFRSLSTIQRALVERLEAGPSHGGVNRVIPLMLLGLLVVFLGGIYVVLDVIEQARADRPAADPGALESRALEAYREGLQEGGAQAARDVDRLESQLRQMAEREQALRENLDREGASQAERDARIRALEEERESIARQLLAAQNEMLAKRALEEELRAANSRLAVMNPKLEELERDIANERAENTRLRKWLAGLGAGLPEPDPAAAAGTGSDLPLPRTDGSLPPGGTDTPPGEMRTATNIDREPLLLDRIRTRLNNLLRASGRGQADTWQVTRLDGVSTEQLYGVVASRYDSTGRLLDYVQAEELAIWVHRDQRRVEFEFRNGNIVFQGTPTPFRGGNLRRVVAENELTRVWGQSGFPFVKSR
ncbi:MAG: hypothetical protein ACYTG6_13155, partial [Planctomycetota bacterium]